MEEFEWDLAKARSNLDKHGIAFDDAIGVFDGPVLEDISNRNGELRWKAIGRVEGVAVAVIYMVRIGRRRISLHGGPQRMSNERTTRRTQETRRQGSTDWKRLKKMSDEEIQRAAERDPHNPPWTEAELEAARLVLPSEGGKVPISIRLDAEVLDYFKAQGSGYQSRINAVLRTYVRRRNGNRGG